MTIGERIYQKRKECGLSQESLGDKLNVSRQTVYKWESNQSVPELNKLIAMADILKVRVGWLISGEEDDKNNEAYKDVADRIIKIMADSNISANKGSKQKRSGLKTAFCLVLVICLGISLFGLVSLENKYKNLENNLQNNNYYFQRQISSITDSVHNMLDNYNNITLNSNVSIQGYDFANNTVSFDLSAKPKTYTSQMKTVFHISNNGKDYDFAGVEGKDRTFHASATIPLNEKNTEIAVEFINGDVCETRQLTSFSDLINTTFPFYDIVWYLPLSVSNNGTRFDEQYCEVTRSNMYSVFDYSDGVKVKMPEIADVQMFLTENDVKIADYIYDEEYTKAENARRSEHNPDEVPMSALFFKRPSDILLDTEKVYAEHIVVTDEYGRIMEQIFTKEGSTVSYRMEKLKH